MDDELDELDVLGLDEIDNDCNLDELDELSISEESNDNSDKIPVKYDGHGITTFNLVEIHKDEFIEFNIVDYLKSKKIRLNKMEIAKLKYILKMSKDNRHVTITGGYVRKLINGMDTCARGEIDVDIYFNCDLIDSTHFDYVDHEDIVRCSNCYDKVKVGYFEDTDEVMYLDIMSKIGGVIDDKIITYNDPFEIIKEFDTIQSTSYIKGGRLYVHEMIGKASEYKSYPIDTFINMQSKYNFTNRLIKLTKEGFEFDSDIIGLLNEYYQHLPYHSNAASTG